MTKVSQAFEVEGYGSFGTDQTQLTSQGDLLDGVDMVETPLENYKREVKYLEGQKAIYEATLADINARLAALKEAGEQRRD